MLHIPEVLSKQQVSEFRKLLEDEKLWVNGRNSAGAQAQQIKNN